MSNDANRPEVIPEWANMEVHPFVALLVARMESNPEEFYFYVVNPASATAKKPSSIANPKWGTYQTTIDRTKAMWNRKEKYLFNKALRDVRLSEAHMSLMATLLVNK